MKTIDLTGKTTLITGATRGIGLSTAHSFINAGSNLVLTGTKEMGREQIDKIINKTREGQIIEYISVDFKSKESINLFLENLKSKDKIDICVNNAGTNHIKMLKDVSFTDIESLHRINLYAPFLILSTVLEKMKRNNCGRVVNIGSLWSKLSRKGRSLYSSSKYGLMGLTVTAALEYASFNVLVNMVSPGFVWTDLSKATLTPHEKNDIEEKIPLGRFAEPEDIANTVLFLCSDMNNFITGQNIFVDGGYICE